MKDGTLCDDPSLMTVALRANEQYGKTIAAFVDKQVSVNLDLPPDNPAEQRRWIESHTQVDNMLSSIDGQDAIDRS